MKAKKITVWRMNVKKMVGKLDLKLVFAQNKITSKTKCWKLEMKRPQLQISVVQIPTLQVNNFQKVPFDHHFIKMFEKFVDKTQIKDEQMRNKNPPIMRKKRCYIISSRFWTISEILTVILSCWTGLYHNCFKSYDTKRKWGNKQLVLSIAVSFRL